MAKYTRFDPRNKKTSRHKRQSMDKDLRLRRVEEEDRFKYKGQQFLRNPNLMRDDEWDDTVLD